MSNKLGKDSFVDVAKRKKSISAKSTLAPNTRSRTNANNKQSTILAHIDTSKPPSEESSHYSRISTKTTRSQLEHRFEELMKKREEQHEKQMAEFAAQMADLKSEYSDAIQDHKSTIEGLQFTVEQSNIANSELRQENVKLTDNLFNVSDRSSNEKQKSKVVTNQKSASTKQTTFAPIEVDDDDDEFTNRDEDSSAQSVTPDAYKNQNKNKNASRINNIAGTPSGTTTGNTNGTPSSANASTQNNSATPAPFTSPLPQGMSWAQYIDASGRTLWEMVPTPAPPAFTQGLPSTATTTTPVQTNLINNPIFSQTSHFTAPSGCLQFHCPTWTKEIKHISCNSDELNDVKAWYEDLRSCLLSASQGKQILPKIDLLTSKYDFKTTLLPPPNQANYLRAKTDYDALSSALRLYLTKKTTFEHSSEMTLVMDLHKSEECGLELLLKILSEVFPHLGSGYIDFVTEVTKLRLCHNDSVDTLLRKTLALQRKLEHTNQIHPPNSIIHKFLSELRQNKDLEIKISPIYLKYNEHLDLYGPNIPFSLTPYDIYKHLKRQGVNLKEPLTIDKPNVDLHNSSNEEVNEGLFKVPTARAAFVKVENKELFQDKKYTKHVTKATPRYKRCTICNDYHPVGPNPELRCPARGEQWIPDWKKKSAAKYNAMHPKDVPDPDFIKAPPPVRMGTTRPTAKQVSAPISDQDDDSVNVLSDEFHDVVEVLSLSDSETESISSNNIRPEVKNAIGNTEDVRSCSADSQGLYHY